MRALWLLAFAATSALAQGEVGAAPSDAPAPAAAPAEELPPLEDELLEMLAKDGPPSSGALLGDVRLLGDGRLRFELDESRDRSPANDLMMGLSLTGRIGLSAPVGEHRATLVVGDGRRIGQDLGTLPSPLVEPAVLGLLYAAHLDIDVAGLFLPARLSLGRMPVVVADGRLVGREQFDPRGRTFDGALMGYASDLLVAQAGGFWLGPLAPGDAAQPSFLGLVEVARQATWYDVALYALAHKDGTPARAGDAALTIATLGTRAALSGFGAEARAGVDGQATSSDAAPLAAAGWGIHAEGALRYGPELSLFALSGIPFVELSAEYTGGAPVGGRAFRAPGGDAHRFLGVLDVAAADNVMSAALAVGLSTEEGLLATTEARVIALADAKGALVDPTGRVLIAPDPHRSEMLALTEVDAVLRVPVGTSASIEGEYGVGFPGPAFAGGTTPMQRLLLSVVFSLDVAR